MPISVVTQYFPDITKKSGTGPNETSVGKPVASRSVVTPPPPTKRPVQGSKAAPEFKPATSTNFGQEALAGTSQVGAEMHFGLGARDGALLMSAMHAGEIAVTPENSNALVGLGAAELTTAKQVLSASEGNGRVTIVRNGLR